MLSRQILAAPSSPDSSRFRTIYTHRRASLSNPLLSQKSANRPFGPFQADLRLSTEGDGEEEGSGKQKRIVQIPRQKYIPVSKAELLDAIVFSMFDNPEDARQFLDMSS